MAEYYPLLVRAVAALPNSTPESRRNVYERAKQALVGQLRKIDPPVPEADIERESRALDEAVAKLEAELNAKPKTETTAKPPIPPRPSPATPTSPPSQTSARPKVEPKPGLPPRPAPGERSFESKFPPTADKSAQAPLIPPRPSVAPPARAPLPREGGGAPPIGPAQRAPDTGASPPPVLAPDRQKEVAALGEAPTVDEAVIDAERKPGKAGWRGFGRSRDEKLAGEAGMPAGTNRGTSGTEKSSVGRNEGTRPLAPQPKLQRTRGSARHWIVGVIVALVVAAIAGLAIVLKDNPEELARRARLAAPAPEVSQPPGKIAQRVDTPTSTAPTPAPANPPAAAPTQAPPPATTTAPQTTTAQTTAPSAAVAPAQPDNVVPVAQRAALLVQAPDQPQKVQTYVGTVVWRRQNVNHQQDQPLSEEVRADIDVPEAKLKVTMIFQKNADATLPASHTIELRFMPADGSPIAAVKQIDVPQMRKEDTPTGDPLAGVPAPITQNYFLVGLTQGDAAVARNIDLIKSRQWFDVPMLLEDNKIAKITFEKGDPGDRALNDAFNDWQ